ncbi:hypothetical protein M8J77_008153 [Diaphorina citri]|nr:hypothetical protein M8J77_008153 [Diaphorina citri]
MGKTFKPNKGLKRTNPRPCTPKSTINFQRTQWSPWGGRRTPKWTRIFETPWWNKDWIPEKVQKRRMAFLLARGVITTLGKGEIKTETSTPGQMNFPETTIHPALFVFYNMLRYDNVKRAYVTPYAELVLDLMGKRHKLNKIIRNGQNTRWLIERGWTSTLRANYTGPTRERGEKKRIRDMMEELRKKYERESKIKRGHRIFTDDIYPK